MPRQRLQRLAPTLAAYLLLVSLGLPLQRIYCACVDQQWVTIGATEHECQHKRQAERAHEHGKKACCHLTDDEAPTAKQRHDCGDTDLLIAQLDVDFTVESEDLYVQNWATDLPTFMALPWSTRPVCSKAAPIRGPTPPPLLHGRDWLVAHQTFLL